MSNYLAVATVTAALSQSLRAAVSADVSGADVTVARPHSTVNAATIDDPTVNLYLFQVAINKSMRNNELANFSSDGKRRQRSQLALDLNYLLTFYGDESELIPQRLLGSAMRSLNSNSVLSRDLIRNTIDPTGSFPYLSGSDLADSIESVKFSHMPFSLEELSKLWAVFLQTPYTLSVAYQGTVVLIDGLEESKTPLPVRSSNLYVNPFRQPQITAVHASEGENSPIRSDSGIVMRGKQLRGDLTRVRIGRLEIEPADPANESISINLDKDLSAEQKLQLRAGVLPLQVVHPLLLGTPAVPHSGVESAAAAMILHPHISSFSVENIQVEDTEYRSADIVLQLSPVIGRGQRAVLLLNEKVNNSPEAYSFVVNPLLDENGAAIDPHSTSLKIPVSHVKAGTYLIRIQVDGATSLLEQDANSGTYTAPTVTIT